MSFDGGFGVTFKIGDDEMGGTPAYTSIAQVKSFNGVEIESLMGEVTGHDSTGGYREVVPSGRFNVGDITLDLAFDISQATHANSDGGLTYAMLNKQKLAYQIVFPDTSTTTWTFDAYASKIKWDSPKEDHVMATVTLSITGQPTIV